MKTPQMRALKGSWRFLCFSTQWFFSNVFCLITDHIFLDIDMYPSDDDDKSYVPDSEAYYSSSSDSVLYPENEELVKCKLKCLA